MGEAKQAILGLPLHVLEDAITRHIVCLLGARAVHFGSFLLLFKLVRIVEKSAANGGHVDEDLVVAGQNRFVLFVNDVLHICIENDFVSIVQYSVFLDVSQHKDFKFTVVLKVAIVDVNDTYKAAVEEGEKLKGL